ncbi:MAG: DM13 domain-containing protein [Chloroflexi bacterium]|nr:DM13 domain-containing protein [Chloroflexota bacterium]
MSIFGELETIFSDYIYPAWPLFLILAIVSTAAAVAVAYRLGWHQIARRHRIVSAITIVALLSVTIPTGYYTISPLFQRTTVCEASPVAGTGAGSERCEVAAGTVFATEGDDDAPADPPAVDDSPGFETQVVKQGEFEGADSFHFGEGTALLIETGPDTYTLRLEDFSVRNGPDLFVYLSPDPDGYEDGALELGGLKGTDGAFNYEIPAGTDVSQFQSAVVWCKAFSVLFATASFG